MPAPIVTVPADLWLAIRKNIVGVKLAKQAMAIDVPDISDDEELRRERIIELAETMNWVSDGQVEIDTDARLSEGDDNGCYVSGWIWCDYSDTEFDKSCAICCETQASPDDLKEHDDHGKLCAACLSDIEKEEAADNED